MAEPSLADSRAKLCRARDHLAALEAETKKHWKRRPYDLSIEGDVDTGEYVVSLRPREPPKEYGLIIGDVIANLRGALDYLVYALAWLDSGFPQEQTQFPIADTLEQFESTKARRLKGLSPAHVAAIEALQPYNGGDWLARLRDLSNTDKHMHLSLVQPDAVGDIDSRDSADKETGSGAGFTGILYVHVDFDIALYETFPEGGPVIGTLHVLESQVRDLIEEFQPAFERS